MGRGSSGDVLLALHSATSGGTLAAGKTIRDELGAAGRVVGASQLLAHLLRLEASGLVHVERGQLTGFALTPNGEAAALDLVGARKVHTTIVFVDLVGFVSFTADHGDEDAHRCAHELTDAAGRVIGAAGGRIVKSTGDGFLAAVPTTADPVPLLIAVAAAAPVVDGQPWPLRAAAHAGSPIEHRGDLFGYDVNLTARLCDIAEPGQFVVTARTPSSLDHTGAGEPVVVRGLVEPVLIHRAALR